MKNKMFAKTKRPTILLCCAAIICALTACGGRHYRASKSDFNQNKLKETETSAQTHPTDSDEEFDPKDISMDAYYFAYNRVMNSDYIYMPITDELSITCSKDGTIVQQDRVHKEQDGSYTPVCTLYSTPTDAYLKLYEDREKYTIYHASGDCGRHMEITKANNPDNWEYVGVVHVWGTDYIAIKDNENNIYNFFHNGPVLQYEGQTDILNGIETYGFALIKSTTLDSPDTWGDVDEEITIDKIFELISLRLG